MASKAVGRSDAVWSGIYQPTLFPKTTARMSTNAIEWMIERKLLEISMNRFTWENLPDEVDVRWLEMNLTFYALSVFHFDTDYDKYFAMQGSQSGTLDMIGNPTEFRVYGNSYYQKTLDTDHCVPIWANYMRVPDWDIIRIYSRRMAEMDRTIEINSVQARRTKILTMSENTRMTIDNINRMIDEGAAAIPVDTSLDLVNAIQNLDLGVNPDSIINMHILRTRQWSECMTMLGINNSNQDKKERLTAAETSGNDDVIATIRATNLKARQDACDRINKRWPNLNVSVDYTTDMVTPVGKDTDPNGTLDQSPANNKVAP